MAENKSTGTRDRILESSGELFRRQGYAGTGIKAILTASDAPYGSLYHFFPGGKEELGAAALREGGLTYLRLVEAFFPEGADVVAATAAFFDGAATVVEMTDYADACPIATVALEVASTSEVLREATADVFNTWIDAATEYFILDGLGRDRAREVALTMLSLLEGAFLFSRALKSTEPMHIAGAAAVAALIAARPG